jgi:steroid delta-isomerase-like uncharacterized protein
VTTTTQDHRATPTSDTPTTQVVRRLFRAISDHDLAKLDDYVHEDVHENFLVIGVMHGREEVRGLFREILGAFPDFTVEIEDLVSEERGNGRAQVYVSWRARGTFTGSTFQGIQANGAAVDLYGVDRMELENGKVRRNTIYYDGAGFARAIGLLPAQNSGAERAMKTAFNAVTMARKRVGL